MFERVIYVSRCAPEISARDTYDIVRVSHNRNRHFGLTGALILLDGFFLQVLEGVGHSVRQRLAVIATDNRHCDAELRQHIGTQHLAFPAAWMAFRTDSEITAATKLAFGYSPGFPADRFPVDVLLDFAQACCHRPPVETAAAHQAE